MRPGGPPRRARSALRPERARGCRCHVQFSKCPQRPISRTRCPSPKPSGSSAVRGYARQRCRESPKRVWTAALLPHRGRFRTSPRRSQEGQCPTSYSPTASPAAESHASPDPKPSVAKEAETRGGSWREKADAYGKMLPGQREYKMAAPMELFCWSGGWGLPSVDLDSLTVLVRGYACVL